MKSVNRLELKFKHLIPIALCALFGVLGYYCYTAMTLPLKPYLTVIGNVKMSDGIGRQSVDLIHALHDDFDIGFFPTRESDLTDVPDELIPIITKPNTHLGKVVIYESSLPPPTKKIFKRMNKFFKAAKCKDQIRIAYSVNESSSLPHLYVEVFNEYFDAIAVPDEFLVEVYKNSGVRIPIFVLPLCLELGDYLKQPLKTAPHKPFCFINLSSMIGRKNHEGLIKAFHLAFGDDPDVQLLLNYRYSKGDALSTVTELLKVLNVKNIILSNNPLDHEDYLQFLLRGDVFITLSKGEGFSIQPREAMALGLPVILSENTAHHTIITTGLALPVSCPTRAPSFDAFKHCYCGYEWVPDTLEAAKRMRDIYENYSQYLITAADRRQWVSQYQISHQRPLYLNLVRPFRVILGDRNEVTAEHLMTTSAELVEKYRAVGN